MEQNNDSFSQNLNYLIQLFNQFRNKATHEGVTESEQEVFKNFDALLSNFEMIKNQIPPEYIDTLGKPFLSLVQGMIEQLQSEIETRQRQKIQKYEEVLFEEKENFENELKEIEILLSNPSLPEDEINKLLDQRAYFTKKIKPLL